MDRGAPSADVLKPNAYELETLSGQPISDPETAIAAARTLISLWDIKAIVVSSVPVPTPRNLVTGGSSVIACITVTSDQAWCVETPLLPVEQKGAGDALMALFVANFLKTEGDLPQSLSASVSAIWSLMDGTARDVSVPGSQELQLVSLQEEFSNPSRQFPSMVFP